MGLLDAVTDRGHEEVVIVQDAALGLLGVIATHSTQRGPALAATRLRPTASPEAALQEALRLSCAMTFEAAVAGLPRGGAAAVFVGRAAAEKSRPFLAAYARALDRLDGRAQAVADIGFEARDLTVLARMTRHVLCRRGPGSDAAELTALGVLECIRAAAESLESPMDALHVAVQGVGQVGYRLARHLAAEGTRLTVADLDAGRAERARDELGAAIVAPEDLASVEADVFSPNAESASLDERTLERLRCRAVVGAARDVLADAGQADTLHARGVLYAPDGLAAGGAIAGTLGDEDEMAVQERVADVGNRLRAVWARARRDGVSPLKAAEQMYAVPLDTRTGGPAA